LKFVHTGTAALRWPLLLHHLTGLRQFVKAGKPAGKSHFGFKGHELYAYDTRVKDPNMASIVLHLAPDESTTLSQPEDGMVKLIFVVQDERFNRLASMEIKGGDLELAFGNVIADKAGKKDHEMFWQLDNKPAVDFLKGFDSDNKSKSIEITR
jgi:hypothetical protein